MNNKILQRLKDAEGFMFDMDGTMVLGDKHNQGVNPLPGAIDMITLLNRKGIPYVFLTNGTVRPESAYMEKLRGVGFPLNDDVCMTPSTVAANYFMRKQKEKILVLGCEGVWRPLSDAGLNVVLPHQADDLSGIDAVYVGWYRDFTMNDLDLAWHALEQGADLYSASMVPFFASAGGRAIGSSYVIAGMLEKLTGKRTKVLGKPSKEAVKVIARKLGVDKDKMCIVGDDPELEVPMAHKAGALGVAVYSGYHGKEEFDAMKKEIRPHLTLSGVDELLKIYQE